MLNGAIKMTENKNLNKLLEFKTLGAKNHPADILAVPRWELMTLLFYAFRYALGRKTYAASDVANFLCKYKKDLDLSHYIQSSICREIKDALMTNTAGMECDKDAWNKVLVSFEQNKDTHENK